MAILNFNAAEVAPQTAMDVMPAGDYLAQISEVEYGENKQRTGEVLSLVAVVIEPAQFRGRKIFDNITVQHQNSEAARIGQSQLSGLCHATGQIVLRDTNQLLQRTACIRLKIEVDKEGKYPDKNRVQAYSEPSKYVPKGGVAAATGTLAGLGAQPTWAAAATPQQQPMAQPQQPAWGAQPMQQPAQAQVPPPPPAQPQQQWAPQPVQQPQQPAQPAHQAVNTVQGAPWAAQPQQQDPARQYAQPPVQGAPAGQVQGGPPPWAAQ